MKRLFLILALIPLLASCGSGYSWSQKLTLVVETPEGEVSGSSTVHVAWHNDRDLFGDAPHWRSEVRGEATVVELGDGKYLFALIGGAERQALRVFHEGRFPRDTDGLAPIIRKVAAQRHGVSRRVRPEAMPLLISFTDISDPMTVARVDPDNLAATFGPGYALKLATLEITDEPLTEGEVERILPWFSNLEQFRRNPGNPFTSALPRDIGWLRHR